MRAPPILACSLALALLSCGGAERPRWEHPVDFAFELEGAPGRLAELRGRPLVLVLMRTSDVVSQLYMRSLADAHRRHAGRVRFLVLTVEPGERPFVGPFAASEGLPFPVGVAEPAVRDGSTPLGELPPIPATFVLDAQGRVVDAAVGVVEPGQIGAALERLPSP